MNKHESDLNPLIKIDEIFMRKIFEVGESTPKESLYLELGLIPIENIVKCRRIIYLHYILTQDKNQLIYKFFQAQLRNPSKGDWSEMVKKDLTDFNISYTFDEIAKMKSEYFKTKAKKACKTYTFNKLLLIKNRVYCLISIMFAPTKLIVKINTHLLHIFYKVALVF